MRNYALAVLSVLALSAPARLRAGEEDQALKLIKQSLRCPGKPDWSNYNGPLQNVSFYTYEYTGDKDTFSIRFAEHRVSHIPTRDGFGTFSIPYADIKSVRVEFFDFNKDWQIFVDVCKDQDADGECGRGVETSDLRADPYSVWTRSIELCDKQTANNLAFAIRYLIKHSQ